MAGPGIAIRATLKFRHGQATTADAVIAALAKAASAYPLEIDRSDPTGVRFSLEAPDSASASNIIERLGPLFTGFDECADIVSLQITENAEPDIAAQLSFISSNVKVNLVAR